MLPEIKGIFHSKYSPTILPLILTSMDALVTFSVPQSERIPLNRSVLYSSVKEKRDDKKKCVFILLMWRHLSVQNARFCLDILSGDRPGMWLLGTRLQWIFG